MLKGLQVVARGVLGHVEGVHRSCQRSSRFRLNHVERDLGHAKGVPSSGQKSTRLCQKDLKSCLRDSRLWLNEY